MPICENCGNDYDKAFRVILAGEEHVFDSFECAIHALAPTCPHCGTRIIGHGVEQDFTVYCCAHCAKQEGVKKISRPRRLASRTKINYRARSGYFRHLRRPLAELLQHDVGLTK